MGSTLPAACSPENANKKYDRDTERDKWAKKTQELRRTKSTNIQKKPIGNQDTAATLEQLLQYKQALDLQTSKQTLGTNVNSNDDIDIAMHQNAINLQLQIQRQIAQHHQQIAANKALQEKNTHLQKQIDELKASLVQKPERRQSIFDKIDALQTRMDSPLSPPSQDKMFTDIPVIDEKMIISALRQKISDLEYKLNMVSPPALTHADSLSHAAQHREFRTLSEGNNLQEFMTKYEQAVSNSRSYHKESTDASDPSDSSYDEETDTGMDVDMSSLSVSKFMFKDVQTESSVMRAVCMKKDIMKTMWGGGSMSSMFISHPLPDEDEEEDEDDVVHTDVDESDDAYDDEMVLAKVQLGQANVPRHSQLIRKRSSEQWSIADMKTVREEMKNQLAHLVSSHVKSTSQSNQAYRMSIDDPKWYAIIKKLNKEIEQWTESPSTISTQSLRFVE